MEIHEMWLVAATGLFLGVSCILIFQRFWGAGARPPESRILQLVQSLVDSWLARFTVLEQRTAKNENAIEEAVLRQVGSMRLIKTNEQHLKELASLLSACVRVQTGLLDRLTKTIVIEQKPTRHVPPPTVSVAAPEKSGMPARDAPLDGLLYLTPTAAQVIELLYKSGPMPASTIKDYVHRSREHTARLMKDLFEQGYVTRETHKLPYRYKLSNKLAELLSSDPNPFHKLKLSYRQGQREPRIANSLQNRPD